MLVVRGAGGVIEEIKYERNKSIMAFDQAKNKNQRNIITGQIQMADQLIAVFKDANVMSEKEFDAWHSRIEALDQKGEPNGT